MAYKRLPTVECPVCFKPYTPTRPENKRHPECVVAQRKQAAAEKKALEKLTTGRVAQPAEHRTDKPESVGSNPTPTYLSFYVPLPPAVATGDRPLKIGVIPDTQCKPGVPLEHMYWAGRYLAERRCDVIVHLGDHWDMVSLNVYEKGLKRAEGRTYAADVEAGNEGMRLFWKGYDEAADPAKKTRFIFLMGNHEERILRAIQSDGKLEGTIGYKDLALARWEVHQFLEVVEVAGIQFSHYFISGAKGLAVSSPQKMLSNEHCSSIMGHNQTFSIYTHPNGSTGIFAGAFYQHQEAYLGPQGNDHRRHLLVLHEAKDGVFDLMQVSLEYLRKRYSKEAA